MPVGKPDDGFIPTAVASNQTDVGSGIDRLLMGGGAFNKTGRIQWATGFENGIVGTDYQITGNGVAVVLGGSVAADGSVPPAWQGNYYLSLVTTAALGDVEGLFKYFPGAMQTGRWGIECMLNLENIFNSHVDFVLLRRGTTTQGTLTRFGRIRISIGTTRNNMTFLYWDQNDVFHQFANVSNILAVNTETYYNYKLVVDFALNTYVRFSAGSVVYDLSSFQLDTGALGVDEKSSAQISLTNDIAAVRSACLDNLILTSDEV